VATFVLVHGAWHGGWCYRDVARLLRKAGHDVFAPTLTGVGERQHLAGMAIGLSTHIEDVASVIVCEELRDVILCGHSYGGMVVTGVADRMPDNVKAIMYLDAFVPESGKSLWDYMADPEKAFYLTGAAGNGGVAMTPVPAEVFAVKDAAWVNRRCVPHPLATFLEPIRLSRPPFAGPKFYVYAEGWGQTGPILTPFKQFCERLQGQPGWVVHKTSVGHGVMVDDPDGLARLLLALA
jgi:pimeloyl-ACP methyl ester carboxylesterase